VFVILRVGHTASDALANELIAHFPRNRPDATPKSVEIVAKLPKTRSGKIMRRVLRANTWVWTLVISRLWTINCSLVLKGSPNQ